jgi:hypothetical protein
MEAQTPMERVKATWAKVLVQPAQWAFSKDDIPALWERSTRLGIAFDPEKRTWVLGHITLNETLIPAAGPFSTVDEAIVSLLGAAATYHAGQSL